MNKTEIPEEFRNEIVHGNFLIYTIRQMMSIEGCFRISHLIYA